MVDFTASRRAFDLAGNPAGPGSLRDANGTPSYTMPPFMARISRPHHGSIVASKL